MFGLRVELPPENPGYAALERHMLLAIRIHRAARLNAPGISEGKAWQQYFDEHVPRGGAHAQRLWAYWRGRLVKDEFPGQGVAASHGQPHAHWRIVHPGGLLFIDLQSMWDDYECSIESLMTMLRSDEERRNLTLAAFGRRQWSVEQVTFQRPEVVISTASVSSVASVTAWNPPPSG